MNAKKFMNDATVREVDRYYLQMQEFIENGLRTYCPAALKLMSKKHTFFARVVLFFKGLKIVKSSKPWARRKMETWVEFVKHGRVIARQRFVLKLRTE